MTIKLEHLINPLAEDIVKVCRAHGIERHRMAGDTPLLWRLLREISVNRAYDDEWPGWANKKRILPYDGRNYCWYYDAAPGVTDEHVTTLLRHAGRRANAILGR